MNRSKRREAIKLWLLVLMLLACKPHPLVCEAEMYFERGNDGHERLIAVSSRHRTDSATPAAGSRMESFPTFLSFQGNDRITVSWQSYDSSLPMELTYSPGEGMARAVRRAGETEDSYPLEMRMKGKEQWVRFGFPSPLCERKGKEWLLTCEPQERVVIADMRCSRER